MNLVNIDRLEDKELIKETAKVTNQLIQACYFGHAELVKYLLNSGPIDLNLIDHAGRDAAQAIEAGKPARALEVAQLLIEAGMSDPSLKGYSTEFLDDIADSDVKEALGHFSRVYSNTCVPISVLPMIPLKSPISSNVNGTIYGQQGETWPKFRGTIAPYCLQLNLEEARYVPSEIRDLALLTFFADFSKPLGPNNGEGWTIRSYDSTRSLVPVPREDKKSWLTSLFSSKKEASHNGVNISAHTTCMDYALYPNDAWHFSIDQHDLNEEKRDMFHHWVSHIHCFGSKLGGCPSVMDSKLWWEKEPHPANPKYCFQLMTDPFLGIYYPHEVLIFARGTTEGYHDQWFLDIQGTDIY